MLPPLTEENEPLATLSRPPLTEDQAPSFTLAILTFYTSGYGVSALDFETVVLGDALGDAIAFATLSDSVAVSAVPVPAAVWLFGSALAGLGWLRRKQVG